MILHLGQPPRRPVSKGVSSELPLFHYKAEALPLAHPASSLFVGA
jgi:hypothetical protein